MILAVDPGYAKCGWAVVRPKTGRVVELGVVVTKQDTRVDLSTDRARRIVLVARELAAIATRRGCTSIAAEQALQFGAAAAIAANLLPWGVLVGLSVMLRAELLEVPAKVWQRAVLPTAAKKVDYDDLARELTAFATGQAEQDLLRVPRPERTHALDAVGIGLFVALTSGATRITEGW